MTKAIIGFLHSTKFTDDQRDKFFEGLKGGGWAKSRVRVINQRIDTDGNYGSNNAELRDEAKFHHTGNKAHLIVTAGGLVTALAASRAMSELGVIKPIVSLIGRTPKKVGETGFDEFKDDLNLKYGGSDLATPNDNVARRNLLVNAFSGSPDFVTSETVALLVNTNSAMWQEEVSEWKLTNNMVLTYPDLANDEIEDNDAATFAKFFKAVSALGQVPKAIVVSSDPFFFHRRNRFVKAANDHYKKPLCFPFKEYEDAADWNSKNITSGHKLLEGYAALGLKVADALSALFPKHALTIDTVPKKSKKLKTQKKRKKKK